MPRYTYPYPTKATVESTRSFSTSFFKKHNKLARGTVGYGNIVWSRNGEENARINYVFDLRNNPVLNLKYKVKMKWETEWKDVDYNLNLLTTPCHFGGERWWFQCLCGKRVGTLYSNNTHFLCRKCCNLTYESCNESKRFRDGHFRILKSHYDAEDYYRKNVRREHYRGKPTRKYKQYLKKANSILQYRVEDLLNDV